MLFTDVTQHAFPVNTGAHPNARERTPVSFTARAVSFVAPEVSFGRPETYIPNGWEHTSAGKFTGCVTSVIQSKKSID